jgi:hypothetical protein
MREQWRIRLQNIIHQYIVGHKITGLMLYGAQQKSIGRAQHAHDVPLSPPHSRQHLCQSVDLRLGYFLGTVTDLFATPGGYETVT